MVKALLAFRLWNFVRMFAYCTHLPHCLCYSSDNSVHPFRWKLRVRKGYIHADSLCLTLGGHFDSLNKSFLYLHIVIFLYLVSNCKARNILIFENQLTGNLTIGQARVKPLIHTTFIMTFDVHSIYFSGANQPELYQCKPPSQWLSKPPPTVPLIEHGSELLCACLAGTCTL